MPRVKAHSLDKPLVELSTKVKLCNCICSHRTGSVEVGEVYFFLESRRDSKNEKIKYNNTNVSMSSVLIDQDYAHYLSQRAWQIGDYSALQEDYSGKARKDYQKRKDAEKAAEKAEQKRIRDAEKAAQKTEQKRIRDAEKAEQKRIRDAEKAAEKAEQKRIHDAEKAEEKAEQKRIRDAEKAAEKAEQKRIRDAEKAVQKTEQKRIRDAKKAEQKRIRDAEKAEQKKTKTCKRNVKESMKKQVASEQNWRCKLCGMQLPGNYEIDHIKAIKNGGGNDRINLQALCRNCHGEKTQRETSGIKEQKKLTMKQKFEQQGYRFAYPKQGLG